MDCKDEIQPSGVPPDVSILKSIQKVPAEVDRLLEERTILGNTVTPNYIRNILDEQYNRISLLHGSTSSQSAPVQDSNVNNVNSTNTYRMYCWGEDLDYYQRIIKFQILECQSFGHNGGLEMERIFRH